jgi:hypothetical protein
MPWSLVDLEATKWAVKLQRLRSRWWGKASRVSFWKEKLCSCLLSEWTNLYNVLPTWYRGFADEEVVSRRFWLIGKDLCIDYRTCIYPARTGNIF